MRNSIMDEAVQIKIHKKMEVATEKQDLKTVEYLLHEYGHEYFSDLLIGSEGGMEISGVKIGVKMLHYAVRQNNMDFVKLLIENGWDVNEIDFFNGNVLFYAIRFGIDQKIITYLIQKGVDIHYRSKSGKTTLMMCIHHSNFATGEVLMRSGIGLDGKCKYNGNAIEMLERYAGRKIMMIEKEDVNRWMDMFHRNQSFLNEESVKILKMKRLQCLF